METKKISTSEVNRLLNHGPVVLVTCGESVHNIITIAWITPVSHDPPLLAISVSPKRYSCELIEHAGEFVVNVPPVELLKSVWICGTKSGRQRDKWSEAKLTKSPSEVVSPPHIAECMAWLECKVVKSVEVGDHILFVGEVLSASVRKDAFDHFYHLNPPHQTLHHLGRNHFAVAGRIVKA
ncbi:hypothetical protein AMJ40_01110 [candidate division TA06 bacterium DG_26]|uniref:Flavin reductase like domain-containing protein n=1 Tax=candidate division TA06 bacterium DG_26 TaxID=1703771 RepID=A0A0S7WLL9_UNCT6|nr:MAG: hypothetical protein AMJ40_01110 [candidate division TA06 bacterium DG_26]